jgi:CHAT domain-containing protein/Tfp pilus assembly protein PilF
MRWIGWISWLSVAWVWAQAPSQADSLYQAGAYAAAQAAFAQLSNTKAAPDSVLRYALMEGHSAVQGRAFEAGKALLRDFLTVHASAPPQQRAEAHRSLALAHAQTGQIDSALDQIEQVLHLRERHHLTDTLLWAQACDLRAFLHVQRSEAEAARHWIERAGELRSAYLDSLDRELGYGANTRYLVLDALGDLKAAEQAARQAWRILTHHLPPEHPHLAIMANNLSLTYADQGDPRQARYYLRQAIASNRAAGRRDLLIENYHNLAYLYVKLEDWSNAEIYNRRVLQLADSLPEASPLQRATYLDGLGATYMGLNHYAAADSTFRLALALRRRVLASPHPDLAKSWYNLGTIAVRQEQFAAAQDYLQKAEAQYRALPEEPTSKLADVQYESASVHWQAGQYQEAITTWRRCATVYAQRRGRAHAHTLETLALLSEAFHTLGQRDSARRYLDHGWQALGWTGGEAPFRIETYARSVLDLATADLAWHLAAGDLAPTASRLSLIRFEALLDWLPEYLALYPPGSHPGDVYQQAQRIYRQIAYWAHLQGNHEVGMANLLLRSVQATRGASIQAALQQRQALRFAQVPDSLVQRSQSLSERLRFLAQRGGRLQASTDQSQARALALEEWQRHQDHLVANYPRYFQARFGPAPVAIGALQTKIGDESLLAYLWLDSALLLLHVEPDDWESHYLPLSTSWADSLQQYQALLRSRQQPARLATLSHWLYRQLLPPTAKDLGPVLRILPDGPLYRLNFELLLSERPADEQPIDQWPYLLRRHAIYYAHELIPGEPSTGPAGQMVLGIAPGFAPDLKAAYRRKLSPQQAPDSLFLRWLSTPWSLAFVQNLAERSWGKALTKTEATESAVLRTAKQAAVLHFGTHALLRNAEPLMSFLALTPDPPHEEDGYLHTYELYQQSLPARLAVLTACETGLGPYRPGEGLLSLAHAFRYAGCPSVVHSLWAIDDQQSQRVIEGFYAQLRTGVPTAQALQQAKLSYLAEGQAGYIDPFFWGGLVLTGANAPVEWPADRPWWWLGGLGGLLLLLLLWGFTRGRRIAGKARGTSPPRDDAS